MHNAHIVARIVCLQALQPPRRQIQQRRVVLWACLPAAHLPLLLRAQKIAQTGIDQATVVPHARVPPGRLHRLVHQGECVVRRGFWHGRWHNCGTLCNNLRLCIARVPAGILCHAVLPLCSIVISPCQGQGCAQQCIHQGGGRFGHQLFAQPACHSQAPQGLIAHSLHPGAQLCRHGIQHRWGAAALQHGLHQTRHLLQLLP